MECIRFKARSLQHLLFAPPRGEEEEVSFQWEPAEASKSGLWA